MFTDDRRLPDVVTPASAPAARRATRREERALDEIHGYGVEAWTRTMKEQIDSQALGEAVRTAIHEEIDTFDEMMLIAGSSQVKQTLVIRTLNIQSNINNARLRRRFS